MPVSGTKSLGKFVLENDIAVVGMGARLPDAQTVSAFWRNLASGHCSVRDLTDEQLLAAGETVQRLRDPRYVKSGVVLDGFDEFDAEFFGLSPKEAAIMDPQHRQFLECTWEALEDSTHVPDRFDGPVGVFAGCGMGSYFAFNVLRNRQLMEEVGLFLLRHTGNDKDFLATRVSYCFDLKGPSINVQTACSTSLVAIHYACQSLLSGEVDMALAGGSTIEVPHGRGYTYTEGEILSPDGRCRAFDHRSRGTVFGSGAATVALRRLEDAVADRDHIYAVIKGSAINNDGRSKVGYLAPSVDGQAAAIAEAQAMADVDPADVDYIECHGTGTEIGDPIEVSALEQAFAEVEDKQGCGIGSVKTNIGHLDTAAGVASFIKVCLSLHHEQIPPTVNYEAPNPMIDFKRGPFFVNDALRPWPRSERPRFAGVQSLGVGGTNAHVVVGEAPHAAATAREDDDDRAHVIVWSARSARSLDDYACKLAVHLRENPSLNLGDVAGTLAHGRQAFSRRRVTVGRDRDEVLRALEGAEPRRVYTHTATEGAKVVFLLPGGGAQYRHMGKGLYATDPVFRQHVDKGLELMDGQLDVDLREVWLGDSLAEDDADAAFDRPSVQLPAIFICEYALARCWQSSGVQPVALLGHSLGENAAACLAGVFSFEDGLRLVTLRGKLFEKVEPSGMLSVPLPEDQCRRLLPDNLDLAVVNAPELCVVSGRASDLDAFAAALADQDVEVQRVRIAIAAHSRLLDPILDEFRAFVGSLQLSPPALPLISNRTGTWITDEQATDPEYWVQHLRSTVLFAAGADLLLSDDQNVFLEVGPGRALSSLARANPKWTSERSSIASLRHPDEQVDDADHFVCARARLWAAGVELPLQDIVREGGARLSLPTYAFRHQRYWVDPDPADAAAADVLSTDRVEDISKWLWRPAWVSRPAAADIDPAGTWIVFADEVGVAPRVTARLQAAGASVVEVRLGDAFTKLGENRYALAPELGREGYDALLADLAASGQRVVGVVHAWLLTRDKSFRPGSSFFHRCEEQGFFSLFFLAQALGAEELPEGFRVVVLTNETIGPEGEADCAEKATVIGPCLVMPRELPGLSCALVDVRLPAKPRARRARPELDQLAGQVLSELTSRGSGVVSIRGTERWELDHAAAELPVGDDGTPALLRERGTYLITGGLGGVGSLVAEWLVRVVRARLVLVGRRRLPERGDWDTELASAGDSWAAQTIQKIRFLESLGGEVHVCSADVANVIEMERVVAYAREHCGVIHGVFHAAGTVEDELIASKEQATVERVMAPKVQGALVLDEVLGDEPVDFTVLFSSTSAVLGPPGQVDYTAANAFLNAIARRRSSAGKPTLALQWGVWNRVGMTSEVGAEADGTGGRPETVDEPLFDELIRVGVDELLLNARMSCESSWLLDEHRTADGHALLPGTGYLEMAAQALAAVGEESGFELRDLYFFQPLYVADGAHRAVRVRLRRSIEGFELQVQSEDERAGWQTHSQARVLLRAMQAPANFDVVAHDAACGTPEQAAPHTWLPSPQEAHLRFGPRWRVLREVRIADGKAAARVALPGEYAEEANRYRLHPAALDLATGFAMELIPGYDSSRLWVPLAYRSVRVFGRLPAEYRSCVTGCERVDSAGDIYSVDLTLCTLDGAVVVEVEGFQLRRLAPDQQFAVAASTGVSSQRSAGTAPSVGGSAAEQLLNENIQKGILASEGVEVLRRILSRELPAECVVSSVPLPGLFAELDRAQSHAADDGDKFSRPELDTDYVSPRDDIEKTLVRFWEDLLGIDRVGVHDDFFELGGHSLVAVRLFARIKKTFRVDYPMSVLFAAPTVAKCAEMLRADGVAGDDASAERVEPVSKSRFKYLVGMHPSRHGDGTPFFLVAGMFGNVLNLRHLAQLVGADRPFYGLQARGLFGDSEPHHTFEDAARDYIEELRTVQPHGPYLLGGFSGGGLTAYEMARQLRAAGEQVARLVLLDTPLPTKGVVGRGDRLKIQWQRLKTQGPVYVGRWLKNRVAWELSRVQRRLAGVEDVEEPATFHSQVVEAAFRAALSRYQVEAIDVPTWLFRPALDTTYDLGDGRFANKDRELVQEDNGWTPYLPDLRVVETPGDHDSMVLEPNVRSLATVLRGVIDAL